jgi:phosphoribosylanthranilate isomerase
MTRATEILSGVPPYIGRYAVTHLTDFAGLLEITTVLPIDILQVHAEPEPAVIARLRNENPSLRIIKSVHIVPGQRPGWERYVAVADAFILDSIDLSADRIGGTGQVHDWSISAAVAAVSPRPVILAGGLRPGNVRQAVSRVRPWAVNVNSGVESEGYKDAERIREFVKEVSQFSHSIKDSD